MFGGLNRLLAATAVAGAAVAFLVAPSSALACSGGPSAVNVYKPCLPTGGGGKPAGGDTKGGGPNTAPASGNSTPAVPIKTHAAEALKHAGKDRRLLSLLVHHGPSRLLQEDAATRDAGTPTALGSAFDLGSGPTALLIVLAGTAVLLLGGSGMRLWRSRHRA
ncbi:MAG TPA: hypothetical protein VGK62_02430 [Gaiellaceae bacterium]